VAKKIPAYTKNRCIKKIAYSAVHGNEELLSPVYHKIAMDKRTEITKF
jgi:hypothetical protein